MRPFCDFPVALILSCLYNQFWLQNNQFCLYRNSNAVGPSCSPASPSYIASETFIKEEMDSWTHHWATYLGCKKAIFWPLNELLYVPCVMYMHTTTLNETFLCTLHTCSRCSVSYDTSTGGMDGRAARGRESEYVFHSKENKELSRALDVPGFHCRMVLTISQKSIPISSFPI